MKKIIAATAAGLLLVAGQAAATTQASARVGDRVGARAAESSELTGVALPLIAVAAFIASVLLIHDTVDGSESD